MKKSVLCLLFMMWSVFQGFAQTVISGTIRCSQGETLPGVGVRVKNGSVGISSENDGKYSITTPSSTVTLIFSLIGMKTKEVAIQGQNVIDVVLEGDAPCFEHSSRKFCTGY